MCDPVGLVPFHVITDAAKSTLFNSATLTATFSASLVATASFFSPLQAVNTDATTTNAKTNFFHFYFNFVGY